MDRVDCVVTGAGAVGLAIGRELSLRGLETLVIEKATAVGTETSARNSEVIHAGLYYPPGSLKAGFCVRGKEQLYAFATARGIQYQKCGKLIVATGPEQEAVLQSIADRASACGVSDLSLLSAGQAKALEPALACVAALHSPSTGIIDSHAYMLALQAEIEGSGGGIALNTEIVSVHPGKDGFRIETVDRQSGERFQLLARHFVNSAGLWAGALAACIDGLDRRFIPEIRYAKGNYFSVSGMAPFSRLIYPVPEPGGLGVHLTRDLAGTMRFGPDVEWVERIDYTVDPNRAARFDGEIRKYWPGLRDGALEPAYSGIRPKPYRDGQAMTDFVIEGAEIHGVPGLVNLFGIESPGLTASLAIAQYVAGMLK
ncbi:MAG: NAD(P)/FAD-dependent oxidoreductase [Rhizobiaceae bacterium]|nr:MAG: NAD(P)/FAD-dependent oxidoreductase [Rhizobiaceae bacterium]